MPLLGLFVAGMVVGIGSAWAYRAYRHGRHAQAFLAVLLVLAALVLVAWQLPALLVTPPGPRP